LVICYNIPGEKKKKNVEGLAHRCWLFKASGTGEGVLRGTILYHYFTGFLVKASIVSLETNNVYIDHSLLTSHALIIKQVASAFTYTLV